MRRRGGIFAGLALAVGLLVVASVLWAEGMEFGWFAYAPEGGEVTPNVLIMTPRRHLALALATVGVLCLGFVGGFAVGRRSAKGRPE